MVPRSATSKYPFFVWIALVKAPLTCPKRVDSNRSGGSDPEFTATNIWSARGELAWMALATNSLPVPVSPVIMMVDRLDATCLLYTSDAADDLLCVDLGGRRIIKKK